jgi:signal peptidase I
MVADHYVTVTRAEKAPGSSRTVRHVDRALTVLVVGLLAVLGAVVIGDGLGYRMVTIKSGSMTPTFAVGEVILESSVSPLDVRPGQIVTFRDPALGQDLVTHRIVSMRRSGDEVQFVTKGDANKSSERWNVPVSGHLGKELFVLPGVGAVLAAGSSPTMLVAGVVVACLVLAYIGLRWIWREEPVPAFVSETTPA